MPKLSSVRRNVRRQRQKVHHPQANPVDLRDLTFPENSTKMENGEEFLLYDSGPDDPERFLLLGTARNLEVLSQARSIFLDGTFKIVPELFYQLYTIHALTASGFYVPCVMALLPGKSNALYARLFTKLKELCPGADPAFAMLDFERAAMNAVAASFPNIEVTGCFYHLSQCIYRKVQAEGLQNRYQESEEFAVHVRMIAALAFVPLRDVVRAFEELQEHVSREVDPVLMYFEDSYIGRKRGRHRVEPMFKHNIWNVNERALNDLPKTNNNVEGWHRKMKTAMGASHPTIWCFLNIMKKEQAITNLTLNQEAAGNVPDKPRKQYKLCAQRIKVLVETYSPDNIINFLRGVSHNLSF